MRALREVFSFRPDWHQDECARPLVGQYQVALDSVLQSHPGLQERVADCVHCGTRFLAHPRNARRRNLHCPFGCQEYHRRQRSCQRSAAHYATPEGKAKKERLNARRCRQSPCRDEEPAENDAPNDLSPATNSADEALPEELPQKLEVRLEGVVLDESSVMHSPMLPYVRMLLSSIEGVAFTQQELVSWLRQAMRQHSIARQSRTDYVLRFLNRHPP